MTTVILNTEFSGISNREIENFGCSQGSQTTALKTNYGVKYEEAVDLVYRDTNCRTFRTFFTFNSNLTVDEQVNSYIARYVTPGFWHDLQKRGVINLLLSPSEILPDNATRPANVDLYITRLCEFIKKLRYKGVGISHTSFWNEPAHYHWTGYFCPAIKLMRSLLPSEVNIIVTESANCDNQFLLSLNEIKADVEAWAAVDKIAVHSYSNPLTGNIVGYGKPVWQTESGDVGNEIIGRYTIRTVSRLANDFSKGAVSWFQFFGIGQATASSDDDDGVKLVCVGESPNTINVKPKYHALKDVLDVIPYGTKTRWTTYKINGVAGVFGYKKISFLYAIKPNDKISLVIANNTGYPDSPGYDSEPSQTYEIKAVLPELANVAFTQFNQVYVKDVNNTLVTVNSIVNVINGNISILSEPMSYSIFTQI